MTHNSPEAIQNIIKKLGCWECSHALKTFIPTGAHFCMFMGKVEIDGKTCTCKSFLKKVHPDESE